MPPTYPPVRTNPLDPPPALARLCEQEPVSLVRGVHQCLGQLLARAELVGALCALSPFPGRSLAVAPEEVKFKHEMAVYGVRELPVEWDR